MTTKEEGNRGMEANNRLIAEFMGYKVRERATGELYTHYEAMDGEYIPLGPLDECKYDTSWDWLMPVVIKIKNLTSDNFWVNMYKETVPMTLLNLDIQITYAAIIEFITYFNKGKDAH